MRKIVLLAAFTLAANILFAQWINNNGFESWSNPNGYNTPDNWNSFNDFTAASGVYTCMKGTPAPVGNSYLKLITKSVPGVGIVPGMVTNGELNTSTMKAMGGQPFSQTPSHLTGKWLFMAATTADIGFISVYLTHTDAATGVKDTVALAQVLLPDMEMSWVDFSIPFVYYNSNTPDTCLIIASASGHSPLVNSYLYLDNLDFTIPTNIEVNSSSMLKVYPNPFHDQLQIDAGDEIIESLLIFDATGRICYSKNEMEQAQKLLIPTSEWTAGQYWAKVVTNQSAKVISIVK